MWEWEGFQITFPSTRTATTFYDAIDLSIQFMFIICILYIKYFQTNFFNMDEMEEFDLNEMNELLNVPKSNDDDLIYDDDTADIEELPNEDDENLSLDQVNVHQNEINSQIPNTTNTRVIDNSEQPLNVLLKSWNLEECIPNLNGNYI